MAYQRQEGGLGLLSLLRFRQCRLKGGGIAMPGRDVTEGYGNAVIDAGHGILDPAPHTIVGIFLLLAKASNRRSDRRC